MGEPYNILSLAQQLISMHGLKPGEDIPIVYTGLRPGDKLHETLWEKYEEPKDTRVEGIKAVRYQIIDKQSIEDIFDRLLAAVQTKTQEEFITDIHLAGDHMSFQNK